MTTVLVCATPEVESDLCHTLFWRDDLERYVADRAEDAGALALTTEPHIVVVDLTLNGADRLITGLRHQALPHPVSIVALAHDPEQTVDDEEAASAVDTVLTLPASPVWDESLVQVLQVPTRKQARYDVRFDVVSMLRSKPGAHRGLVLNISAGGLLVECAGLPIHPGDDVTLSLPIPGLSKPVEGRARVVRTPVEEHIGLRFEAFAGNGDASVRHFLETLAAQQAPPAP
ncbi:MAG TPA: PilZ domain-containing protein [Vicinamibacteria bacterium]|nr:PilZ domain-containing protein [Vicinamibacteria bacterium]